VSLLSFALRVLPHHRHRHCWPSGQRGAGAATTAHLPLVCTWLGVPFPYSFTSAPPSTSSDQTYISSSARLASINIGGAARGFSDPSKIPTNANTEPRGDFGLIGLAVMGQNLILNAADHGFNVIAFNRTVAKVDHFLANEAKGK
jgi:hypothetical protein